MSDNEPERLPEPDPSTDEPVESGALEEGEEEEEPEQGDAGA